MNAEQRLKVIVANSSAQSGDILLECLDQTEPLYKDDVRSALLTTLNCGVLDRLVPFGEESPESLRLLIIECIKTNSFVKLNNMGRFVDDLRGIGFEQGNAIVSGLAAHYEVINGLHDVPATEAIGKDYSYTDKSLLKTEMAIIRAMRTLNKLCLFDGAKHGRLTFISSSSLTELIVRRPQDVDTIVRAINVREIYFLSADDISYIEEIIDSEKSLALMDGVL